MIESLLTLTAPLLLAALGGLYSERAGILNISLEGLMLFSAYAALHVASLTGSLAAGLLGALGASLALTLLFGLSSLVLKNDPFVSGLGINLLAYPMVKTLSKISYGTEGTLRPENLPSCGSLFFPVLALLLTGITYLFLEKTHPGRLIRLCGGSERRLREKGHSPEKVKWLALVMGSLLAGLSGASLSLPLGAFVPGISAGKGWIALVAVYLGGRKPFGILPAMLFFSLFDLWAMNLQHYGRIPTDIVLGLPYFLTLVLTILIHIVKNRDFTIKKW